MTSRRFFIGPIPKGWISGHRKSWYKSRLQFRNYTSKTLSFSADPIASHYRQQVESHEEGQPGSPSRAQQHPLEDAAFAFTNINDELTPEQEADQAAQEEEAELEAESEPQGELRTLTHPSEAAEETEQTEAGPEQSGHGQSQSSDRNEQEDEEEDEDSNATPRPGTSQREQVYDNTVASSSFVTAREYETGSMDSGKSSSTIQAAGLSVDPRPESPESQNLNVPVSGLSPLVSTDSAMASEADSTTQLIQGKGKGKAKPDLRKKASKISQLALEQQEPQNEEDVRQDENEPTKRYQGRITKKIATYNINDNVMAKQQKMRSRIAKTQGTISANRPRRRKLQDGEIIKAEKMLVSVQETYQEKLPADFTENDSLRTETRSVDKWREFLVVCRKSSAEHAPFALQMYRTRVIPDAQSPNNKSRPHYEIRLNHKNTHVNLYSSLDKTIVIWHPRKRGIKLYIIRPKSTAHAAEWYTFIRLVLGWKRPKMLPINVPDLGVTLEFRHPFKQLEARLGATEAENQHTTVLNRSAADESFAAKTIIQSCIELLEGRPEWAEVLKAWSKTEKMGLAWKRYDRLEWVFGSNEENMYGSMAMESSHELELRPRHHYLTTVKQAGHREEEPAPVEGFLIRLTSQKGVHQKKSKMFFKRLYFFTQDQYLLFCRPAKAFPPAPPKFALAEDPEVPSSQQILNEMPRCWEINPYPMQDGDIAWLTSGNEEFIRRHDGEAYAQMQRNVHNISHADGHIDFCRVKEVRHVRWGTTPADSNLRQGPAVDFHPEPEDSRQDDGSTKQFDDDRTFEMVLQNGLVIRLQAYDTATRDEWVKRLDALVKYWRVRCADDAAELKAVRQRNLKLLDIDEEMESIIGQFARKWEVKKAEASPHLHNICSLVGCRTIKMSGQLYRKPRRHGTFSRCHVLLTSGKLLIFSSTLRKRNGVQIPHIHQELEATIDLSNCYIYSGPGTESDLLYANQTFDSNNPGIHALPRIYLSSDTLTSRDEDTAITFVVWQPLQKSYFRAQERDAQGGAKHSFRHVSTLGKHGRTIVFKARTRVEKDRWVLCISSEIDRLQEEKQEEMRIVSL